MYTERTVAMPGTLDILRSRWQENVDQLRALEERATTEDRDLTEAEQANSQMLRSQVTSLDTRIRSLAELETSVTGTNELLRNLPVHRGNGRGEVIRPDEVIQDGGALLRSQYPTPGDYMHDIIHAQQGDMQSRERLSRALQNEVTADVPGIVPEPIVGDVINIIDASRPLVTALRSYSMPQYGASFTRPKVAQHTIVGEQTAQKTELPSRKFTVNPLPVNKMTLGGAIDVAFQVIDWTQPSALNAITTDLADQYSIQTEAVTAGLIHTAATVTNVANAVTVATDTAADWIAGLAEAAAEVYSGCLRMPDLIACSPDVWARLVGIVDTTGRPIMAAGSPTNSAGTLRLTQTAGSILGLPLVVSPGFPTGTCIVMASSYAEVYEDRRGALRVVEPKLLGWEIAYYGYFAGLVTEAKAFVQVIPPA
jgi:HK97 family phage major capsid protein